MKLLNNGLFTPFIKNEALIYGLNVTILKKQNKKGFWIPKQTVTKSKQRSPYSYNRY